MLSSRQVVFLLVAFVAALCASASRAAQAGAAANSGVVPFKAVYPKAQITFNAETGIPSQITGLEESTQPTAGAKTPFEAVDTFLHQAPFKSLFSAALDPQKKQDLEPVESHVDPTDHSQTIVTYRQRVQGLPVFGSEAKFLVTTKEAGAAVSTGFFALQSVDQTVTTLPQVEAAGSQKAATDRYRALLKEDPALATSERALFPGSPEPRTPKLIMFDPTVLGETKEKGLRPTWLVKVGGMVFFIDARNGTVLHEYRNVHSLTSFQIDDFNSRVAPAHPVLSEGGSASAGILPEATSALRNSMAARTFFGSLSHDVLGRCICDDDITEPHPLHVNIRFGGTPSALWEHNQSAAYFAPGYASAPDVVTHELMHGVTEYVSCLTPDGPSGAVDEFISDFYAAVYRQSLHQDPWVIADSLPDFRPPKQPLRSFKNPHLNGFHPDQIPNQDTNRGQPERLPESVTIDNLICANDLRNHCAHYNSGILNKAAYLAVRGSAFNGQTVNGIGMQKMMYIINSALAWIGSVSNPSRMAALIIDRCDKLVGAPGTGITTADCGNVRKAYRAVELP